MISTARARGRSRSHESRVPPLGQVARGMRVDRIGERLGEEARLRTHAFDPRAQVRVRLQRQPACLLGAAGVRRSEEHTSELQSLLRISYAVFCLNKTICISSTVSCPVLLYRPLSSH